MFLVNIGIFWVRLFLFINLVVWVIVKIGCIIWWFNNNIVIVIIKVNVKLISKIELVRWWVDVNVFVWFIFVNNVKFLYFSYW